MANYPPKKSKTYKYMNNKSMEKFYEEYVEINGIQQYFIHYTKECDNVVLVVHGGMTEAQLTYKTVLRDRMYSLVYYDQRGTGKTQFKNKSRPEEVTLDVLVEDLDHTIHYVRQKYKGKRVIVLGHSRGSVLAIEYLKTHDNEVDAYIGMGQIICFKEGMEITFKYIENDVSKRDYKVIKSIRDNVELASTESLKKASIDLEKLQNKYHLAGFRFGTYQLVRTIMKSPIFKLTDISTLLTTMKTNINLFSCVGGCDIRSYQIYSIPVYFLCGSDDWQAPGMIAEQYCESITAPQKGIIYIENAGHFTDIDNPVECMNAINEICKNIAD